MKKRLLTVVLVVLSVTAVAQTQPKVLDLQECHRLALESNNELKISKEKVSEAEALEKMALSEMFPKLSANATYNWNQKSIQLLSDEQQSDINHIGTTVSSNLTTSMASTITQLMQTNPTMAQLLLQSLGALNLESTLNGMGESITDALNTDMTHVWTGAVTVTQPVYLGGKLRELYKTARTYREVQGLQYNQEQEELLIKVDEAYWQVISVQKKQQLAQQYVNLLDTLNQNVEALKDAEMATDADVTKVRVKLNEAQMSLAKANSGLALSKMLLYQICGLDVMGNYEVVESADLQSHQALDNIDMTAVLDSRRELQMLEKSQEIANSAVKIAASGLKPNLMATGAYIVTNPNLYNGFQNEFGGMFTVGAVLNIPICHADAIYALKAAKHKRNVVQYQLQDATDKIKLQVNKVNYELNVSNAKKTQAETNLTNAEENLHNAQVSFQAGMISSSDLMAAQTAWLSASSELLDATIEVQMNYLYLQQALGK